MTIKDGVQPNLRDQRGLEDASAGQDITWREVVAIVEAERDELLAFADDLGFIETPVMLAIREKVSRIDDNDPLVVELITEYRELALVENARQDSLEAGKKHVGLLLITAWMYHVQGLWKEVRRNLQTAHAYASERSTQFPEFKQIKERIERR